MNTASRIPPEPPENDDDGLERRLARNPWRAAPPEWRDAILARAAAEARVPAAGPAPDEARPRNGVRIPPSRPWADRPVRRLLDLLSSGWSVAAAAWLLVFTLEHWAAPAGSAGGPPRAPFSDAALAEIRIQQRLMQEATLSLIPFR